MTRDTSRDAYFSVMATLPEKRRAVFIALADDLQGRGTSYEVARKLGRPVHIVTPRLSELEKLGVVRDSRKRRVNPESGRKLVVWEIVIHASQ